MSILNYTPRVEGNLASDPYIAPDGSRVTFRVLHNSRIRQADGTWTDGRTAAADVSFYGDRARRIAQTIQNRPDLFAKGVAVIAWGQVADQPRAWIGRDGKPAAALTLHGERIVPDQLRNDARAAHAAAPAAAQRQDRDADPFDPAYRPAEPEL